MGGSNFQVTGLPLEAEMKSFLFKFSKLKLLRLKETSEQTDHFFFSFSYKNHTVLYQFLYCCVGENLSLLFAKYHLTDIGHNVVVVLVNPSFLIWHIQAYNRAVGWPEVLGGHNNTNNLRYKNLRGRNTSV